MLVYGLTSNESKIDFTKTNTAAEPTIMLITVAIDPNINSKKTEIIMIAINENNMIPKNLPHPKFLTRAKTSLNLKAAANSSFATTLHKAIISIKPMNIANIRAINNMIPPIALTVLLTDSFTANINPSKNKITGKME